MAQPEQTPANDQQMRSAERVSKVSINKFNGEHEAYFADKPGWGGIGKCVVGARTSDQVIKIANLGWNVEQQPLFTETLLSDGTTAKTKVETHQANIRGDNGELLGVVGKNWKPFQNTEAFSLIDSLASEGQVVYESAGALKGGKVVWMLAKMNSENHKISVRGDEHHRYLMCYLGHDGSTSINILPTDIRAECWNSVQAAVNTAKTTFRIHHNARDFQHRVNTLRDTIVCYNKGFDELMEVYEALCGVSVQPYHIETFFSKFAPLLVTPVDATDELAEAIRTKNVRSENLRTKILSNWDTEQTCKTRAANGNLYGLYNAVTHYYDHVKGSRSGETRFENALMGYNCKRKMDALNIFKDELLAVS